MAEFICLGMAALQSTWLSGCQDHSDSRSWALAAILPAKEEPQSLPHNGSEVGQDNLPETPRPALQPVCCAANALTFCWQWNCTVGVPVVSFRGQSF